MRPHILLAIRVGPSSIAPARAALELAAAVGGHVTVLNVAPELSPLETAGADGMTLEDTQERIVAESRAELRSFAERHLQGMDVSLRVARGSVGEQVAAVADEIGARYVVVGTRGRGTLTRLILGDTAQEILQHTRRPVLVVPLEHEGDPDR